MPWSLKSSGISFPFRRKNRYVINEPDPTFQVVYLGNVMTTLGKGDEAVEKALTFIWKTHLGRTRPDLQMKLSVTRSGLKAETRPQGLTEYWSHRITFCTAPTKAYPKVFCWIYKHEGKKMKPELRCHAVLCKRSSEPSQLSNKLSESLAEALKEYRREKLSKQNTRLNPLSSAGEGQPKRKQMLSTGAYNFRPPVSASRSAPKLGMIQEDLEELEDENIVIFQGGKTRLSNSSENIPEDEEYEDTEGRLEEEAADEDPHSAIEISTFCTDDEISTFCNDEDEDEDDDVYSQCPSIMSFSTTSRSRNSTSIHHQRLPSTSSSTSSIIQCDDLTNFSVICRKKKSQEEQGEVIIDQKELNNSLEFACQRQLSKVHHNFDRRQSPTFSVPSFWTGSLSSSSPSNENDGKRPTYNNIPESLPPEKVGQHSAVDEETAGTYEVPNSQLWKSSSHPRLMNLEESRGQTRRNDFSWRAAAADCDSVSDESGYHDEKSSDGGADEGDAESERGGSARSSVCFTSINNNNIHLDTKNLTERELFSEPMKRGISLDRLSSTDTIIISL